MAKRVIPVNRRGRGGGGAGEGGQEGGRKAPRVPAPSAEVGQGGPGAHICPAALLKELSNDNGADGSGQPSIQAS